MIRPAPGQKKKNHFHSALQRRSYVRRGLLWVAGPNAWPISFSTAQYDSFLLMVRKLQHAGSSSHSSSNHKNNYCNYPRFSPENCTILKRKSVQATDFLEGTVAAFQVQAAALQSLKCQLYKGICVVLPFTRWKKPDIWGKKCSLSAVLCLFVFCLFIYLILIGIYKPPNYWWFSTITVDHACSKKRAKHQRFSSL